MTDKEKVIELLKSLGIEFKDEVTESHNSIICEEGMAKVSGYYGFCTVFAFEKDGTFTDIGVWE